MPMSWPLDLAAFVTRDFETSDLRMSIARPQFLGLLVPVWIISCTFKLHAEDARRSTRKFERSIRDVPLMRHGRQKTIRATVGRLRSSDRERILIYVLGVLMIVRNSSIVGPRTLSITDLPKHQRLPNSSPRLNRHPSIL